MSRNEIVNNCPNCGGKNKRYTNKVKGVYHCFKCGDSGRVFGAETVLPPNELEELLRAKSSNVPEITPPKYYDLTPYAREYLLEERRISTTLVERLPIYSTDVGILFIFPSGEFWQERVWPPFYPPKWKNCPISGKSYLRLYNVSFYKEDKRVFIVEGVFDALSLGEFANSVAILGKELSSDQVEEVSRRYKTAVLALDSDVPLDIISKNYSILNSHFEQAPQIRVLPKGEDPASLSRDKRKELVRF